MDFLCKPVEASGGSLMLAAMFWTLVVVAIVYWWARKSTNHPEYAAALEAKLDAGLRKVGLDGLADKNAVAIGQTVYQQAREKAARIEAEATTLYEQAKVKYAEAKLLRDRAGTQP